MGMRPGRRHAIAGGGAEALGGALLTLGALTPVAAGLLTGVMTTAIRKVHAKNGPWVTKGGWEYNAVLIAAVAAIADEGPGRPSVDDALFPGLKGPLVAALAVGSGVAGSFLLDRVSSPGPAPAQNAGSAGDPASGDGTPQATPASNAA
jgi:putative oxidoreductase